MTSRSGLRVRRSGPVLLTLFALVGCDRVWVTPPEASRDPVALQFAYSVANDPEAAAVMGIVFDQVDQVWVRIVDRAEGRELWNGPVAFEPTTEGAVVDIFDVEVPDEGGLEITVDLRRQASSLFAGRVEVVLLAGSPPAVPAIVVEPVPATLEIDDLPVVDRLGVPVQLGAEVRFATGHAIPGHPVTWSSSDPDLVAVDSDLGILEARGEGTAEVTATSGSVAAIATVAVSVPVDRLVISPATPRDLGVGEELEFSSLALSADNDVLARVTQWESADPAVATVDGAGRARAVGPGSTEILATAGNRSASAPLTVLAAEQTVFTLPATPVGARSATLNGRVSESVSGTFWFEYGTTPDPESLAVRTPPVSTLDAEGAFSGPATGLEPERTHYFRAAALVTGDTIHGAIRSFTTPGLSTPTSIVLWPDDVHAEVGESVVFAAVLVDAAGDPVSAEFAWSSSDASIATIDSDGVAVASGVGVTTVRAEAAGLAATARLTVDPPIPAAVRVTPMSATAQVGSAVQFAAVVLDANGDTISHAVTWTSQNTSVATVDESGLVRAVAPGTATIGARADDVEGSAQITVAAPSILDRIQTLIAELEAARTASGDSDEISALGKVIDDLQDAVSELQNGPPPHYEHAVTDLRNAARELVTAMDDGDIASAAGTEWTVRVVGIGRDIAVGVIADALAAGGDTDDINAAQAHLAEGDAQRDAGAYEDALDAYKNAVKDGVSALP